MKTSARYIRESASAFQIHPYQSIYTAYTSPLPYNKLSNLKNIQNPWNYTRKTHAFTSERLQILLEMVQNWKKTFDEWRGRPARAWLELEGTNNPYQTWIIDTLVIPNVLYKFFIQTPWNWHCWILCECSFLWISNLTKIHSVEGGDIDEIRLGLIMTQVPLYSSTEFQYNSWSPFFQSPWQCWKYPHVTSQATRRSIQSPRSYSPLWVIIIKLVSWITLSPLNHFPLLLF